MVVAEGVRDVFGCFSVVAATTTNVFNLRHILSYSVTELPLSPAHCDSTSLKMNKAALMKTLESRQEVVPVDTSFPLIIFTVCGVGIIFHETILQHSKST